MLRFIQGELDVLVSTSIIESGIDIPNANTIIVNRADQFGLSDLYQLRGRVGRYNRKASAYFLVPKGYILSSDAKRRLRAVRRFSGLGAGFKVAMTLIEGHNVLGRTHPLRLRRVGMAPHISIAEFRLILTGMYNVYGTLALLVRTLRDGNTSTLRGRRK